MQMVILFFAHGAKEFLNEVIFAVLSYYQHHRVGEHKVVIYTDNEVYLRQWLPEEVTYVAVDAAKVREWRGAIDFVHRVKIEMIRDAFTRFPDRNVLYLDSDVYFKENISFLGDKIVQGTPVMSLDEGSVFGSKLRHFKKIEAYLKAHNNTIGTGPPVVVSQGQSMYNAGVLGIRADWAPLLSEVLAITDLLHPEAPTHVSEQFAFSVVLARQGAIYAAEPHIHHYWYFKEFRAVINAFLQENEGKPFEELVRLSAAYNPERMGSEKLAYKQMNFWQKLYYKIKNRGQKSVISGQL